MRICRCYGWTPDYVLSLTYPQFFCLSRSVRRIRLDETVDTVYAGYTAGKYGGKASAGLFNGRGSFTLDCDEEEAQDTVREYSEETLKASQARLDRFLKRQQESSEE